MKTNQFMKGQSAIVFNAIAWAKTGDLPEGNEKYYQKAEVLNTRVDEHGDWLADVKFENGLISNGHFQRCMKHVN